MRIFLDGCDGTGKSTLATYLSERFKIDKFCLTKDSKKSVTRYMEVMKTDDVVYDRTFLSEVVYPSVFGREDWLSETQVDKLIEYYKGAGLFVICTAEPRDIRQRILRRGAEHLEVIKNIDRINAQYVEIAKKYNLIVVDTSIIDYKTIGDYIEKEIRNGRHQSR